MLHTFLIELKLFKSSFISYVPFEKHIQNSLSNKTVFYFYRLGGGGLRSKKKCVLHTQGHVT